jgi:WD40 repeat protein
LFPGVCLSADGKRIVSGSDDNTIKVWDVAPPAQGP